MPLRNITSQVNYLLPNSCRLVSGKLSDYQNELSSIELQYIEGYGIPRKNEFRAGRSIAKEAANFLGIKLLSISKDDNGCPLWPAPIVGSISHKAGFCGALLGKSDTYSSIGLDIEFVEHLEENVWKTFTSPYELEQATVCNMEASLFANILFSVKEAFFKCLYPLYYPTHPTLSDIIVTAKPTHTNYLETKVSFNNKEYAGGVIFDSKVLISWVLAKKH